MIKHTVMQGYAAGKNYSSRGKNYELKMKKKTKSWKRWQGVGMTHGAEQEA